MSQKRFTFTDGECGLFARYSTSLARAGRPADRMLNSTSFSDGSSAAIVMCPVAGVA